MSPDHAAAAYAALYGPTSGELCRVLPEAGDGFSAMLATLASDPSRDGIERALIRLEGIRTVLRTLHATLDREGA